MFFFVGENAVKLEWGPLIDSKCRCAAKNAVNSNNSQVLPHKIQAFRLWEGKPKKKNMLLFIELHLALRLKKMLDVSTPLHFV